MIVMRMGGPVCWCVRLEMMIILTPRTIRGDLASLSPDKKFRVIII
jgi:hypothetical protein